MLKPLVPVLLALSLFAARAGHALQTAAPPPAADTAGAVAARLLARFASLRSLRASFSGEMTWQGRRLQSKFSLAFARSTAGLRLRLDMSRAGGEAHAVIDGRRSTVWLPGSQMVMRQEIPPDPGRRWDAFANPVTSLVALLAPNAEDRAVMQRTFLPRIRLLPPERVGGETFDRLRGRGAYGADVEIWMRAADATPTRILLRQPDLPRGDRVEYRIEIEGVDQPLPANLFQLAVPKTALDPMQEARRHAARRQPERPANPQAQLRELEARVARAPRKASLRMQLASACQQMGQAGRMVAALRSAVALEPSLPNYQRAWQMAAENSQWKPAMELFRAGLERHGERMLDQTSEHAVSLPAMAEGADMGSEIGAALEKILPRARDPWRIRAALVTLYSAGDNPEAAAAQWLALIDPGRARKPFAPERLAAIEEALDGLDGAVWSETVKPKIAAATRSAEPLLTGDFLSSLASLYLSVDAPEDAARLMERAGEDDADTATLGEIAAALQRKGETRQAGQLFRQALLMCVQEPAVNYSGVLQLVAIPEARAALEPVFRSLAVADRDADPFAAAHWLYLAGDSPGAIAAYERYLASPAGAPAVAPASKRFVAAALGTISARRAGDAAALERLAAVAVDEMPFAEMELTSQQTLAAPLLEATAGTAAFSRSFEALASSSPQSAWVWLSQRGAPEELDGAVLRRALAHILPSLEGDRDGGPNPLLSALVRFGRPEEALAPLIAAIRKNPAGVAASDVTAVAARLRDPAPLFDALREAWGKRPDRREGTMVLAQCRWARGDGDGAIRELLATGDPRKSPELARRVAAAQWRLARRPEAIATLREALNAKPEDAGLAAALAPMLEQTGDLAGALALYRRLAANRSGGLTLPVASGLTRCGQLADAARLLERDLASRSAAGNPGAARQALAGLYLTLGQPQKVLGLFKPLLAQLARPDFDPAELDDADQRAGLSPLARTLEKAKPALARRAYAALLLSPDATADDYQAYLRLAIAARAFDEARTLLTTVSSNEERQLENPRRELCLAILDEATGAARSPATRQGNRNVSALCERILHAHGAPFPHASPEAQIACDALAAAAGKAGHAEEARRYHRWADGIRALLAGDPGKAAALFPELPCAAMRLALGHDPGQREEAADPLDLDLRQARHGLDLLLPAAGGASDCPYCSTALATLDGQTPLVREWLAAHPSDAAAYLVAASAVTGGSEERIGGSQRLERYLKKAVALDPRLAPAWAQLRNLYEQEAVPPAAVLEAAEQAVKGEPEDAAAQVALARALARSGRHKEAEAAWQRARQLSPRVYGAMAGGMPWREEREESEPLLQMLSYLDQRAMMSIRWLMVELPGLPMGGWLGNPGAPQGVVAPDD